VTNEQAPGGPPPLRVFAQSAGTTLDVEALDRHAARFFATRIGFAAQGAHMPVALVVAPEGEAGAVRHLSMRAPIREDIALAEALDADAGLLRLARRCSAVWLIERAREADDLALRLALVLASHVLGPILDPDEPSFFGVKTGRAKLEALRQRR
jgi:hypothetical protein